MHPRDLLASFLWGALARKRTHYYQLVVAPERRWKFFQAIPSRLRLDLSPAHIVSDLPEKAWGIPARTFSASLEFGLLESTLRHAYDRSCPEPSMAVSLDGSFGFLRDDSGELLLDLTRPKPAKHRGPRRAA